MVLPLSLDALFLAQDAGGGGGGLGLLPVMAVLGLLFYFMIIAPERRKQKEHQALVEGLKKNDRVVTIGGIKGVVVNVNSDTRELTVRIDEANNTRIRCDMGAIARVETDGASEEKSSKDKDK